MDPYKHLLTLCFVCLPVGCFETNPVQENGDSTGVQSSSDGTTPDPTTSASGSAGDTTSTTTTTVSSSDGPVTDTEDTASTTAAEPTSASSGTTGPAACAPDETCLPAPKRSWAGPVYLVDHDRKGRTGECPDGTDLQPTDLYFGFEASAANCECSCGDAEDVVCDSTLLEFHGDDSACATPDATFLLTHGASGGGNCVQEPSGALGNYWSAQPLGIDGGSCTPALAESIAFATWDGSSYVCDLDVLALAECERDGVCAGPPPPAFAHGTCVWREGDHSCDGLGPFQEREVRWTGFDDTRDCSECSCGAPEGECAGVLWLHEQDVCASGLDLMPSDGTCFQPDIAVEGARVRTSAAGCGGQCQEVASASCAPAGGDSVGSAEPTGARTYCCTG